MCPQDTHSTASDGGPRPSESSEMPVSGDIYPTAADLVSAEDLDGEVCLYRSDIDEVLVLNTTAADVWRLSDGEQDLETITSMLARAYDTDTTSIRADVHHVVASLIGRGFLTAAGR